MPHVATDTSAKLMASNARAPSCKVRNSNQAGDLTEPSTSAVTLVDATGAIFKVPCEHRYALDYMYSLRRTPQSLAPLPAHLAQLLNSGPNSRWTVRRPNNGPAEGFMGGKAAGSAGPGGRGVGGGAHRFGSEDFHALQPSGSDVHHPQSSLLGIPSHLRPTSAAGKADEGLITSAPDQAGDTQRADAQAMPPPPPPQLSLEPQQNSPRAPDNPSPTLLDGPPPGTGWSSDTSPAGFGGPAGGGRSWGMHGGTIYSEQMPSSGIGKMVDADQNLMYGQGGFQQIRGGDYGRDQHTWDDLWDSPVEGGDCANIFTLGDIRQAEHAIEVQGISADAYVNHETRKILKEQATAQMHQRQPPQAMHGTMVRNSQEDIKESPPAASQGISQDIFFGEVRGNGLEGRSGADAGESRFISMFGPQGGGGPHINHSPPQQQQTPPYQRQNFVGQQQAAAAAVLHSLPYAQQQQIAATWLAARQNPEDKPAADKAMVRDHLLKLLGLNRNESAISEPARPPGLSRPMNPAAPNFAPSGLFNPTLAAQLPTSDLQAKRVSGPIPPPPPPTDYRRPISSNPAEAAMGPQSHWMRRDLPHQLNEGVPSHAGPLPQHPSGSSELSELLQRLVTKHQIAQQMTQQNPAIPDQNLTAQQMLQRQLLAHGNLMPEQVSQVMQHINRNKGTASQLLLAARQKEAQMNSGQTHMARAKSMKGNEGVQPQQLGSPGGGGISPANQALLQHAAASLRQQAAAYGNGSPNTSAAALAQHLQAMQTALQQQSATGADPVRQQATQKQLAIFVQHLQRLRAQQKQQKPPPNLANSPPLPQHHQTKQQQQVYLSNALEQITQNVQRIKAANANQQQQQQQQQQRSVPMPQTLPLNRGVSPVASQPAWNLTPATQQLSPPHLAPQAQQQHPPPTVQQQQQNLDARAQLSSLLRELVSQGGGANAAATTLSLLLQKTPPHHTIHQQIQQLLQQRAEQGRSEPTPRPGGEATSDKENGRPPSTPLPSEAAPSSSDHDAPTQKDLKEEERSGRAALNDGLTNRVSPEDL